MCSSAGISDSGQNMPLIIISRIITADFLGLIAVSHELAAKHFALNLCPKVYGSLYNADFILAAVYP